MIDIKHWPLMRLIRLAIAIGCFITYYESREWFILAIGLLMFVQVLFNTGCSDGSCEIPNQNDKK
ncbi:MAG TPA: hypothetical protein EYG85_04490 [Crocinitomix sp.]|nr:hypothetical protein [Crocinitomix sp.]